MDKILGENSYINPGTELDTGYIFLAQILLNTFRSTE